MTSTPHDGDDASAPSADSSPWQPEIDEIRRRRARAEQLGGPAGVERQHALGKLTARERITALLDADSFDELGSMTGKVDYGAEGEVVDFTPANSVIGRGRIDGARAMVAADDFTVRGGSSEATVADKWLFAERWALENHVPLVRLVDAAGGSIRLLEKAQATKLPGYATWELAGLLAAVPVVGVALGPCAGLGAAKVVMSHFSVMVRGISQVFAAGPQVVAPGIGQQTDKEALGGADVHARGSGVVDNEAVSELEAFEQVRHFLSYLPPNVFELPPCVPPSDPAERDAAYLASAIPRDRRKPYDARKILTTIADAQSVFEIGRYWGRSMITALARLSGRPVGIVVNDPMRLGGAVTAQAAEKVTRFIDLCDTFHLPVVNLVDQPGVYVGEQAERAGTIRRALRLMLAIEQVRVPWATVIMRRAFGIGGGLHSPLQRATVRYAWPSARWGSIPVEGGVEAAFRRELAEADDPDALREQLNERYRRLESPFRTAERFGVEEIIDPAETRRLLCSWVEDAYRLLPGRLGTSARTFRV